MEFINESLSSMPIGEVIKIDESRKTIGDNRISYLEKLGENMYEFSPWFSDHEIVIGKGEVVYLLQKHSKTLVH